MLWDKIIGAGTSAAATPVDLTFTDSASATSPSNPHTFSALSIGAADADRKVIVAVDFLTNGAAVDVTVGGITAREVVSSTRWDISAIFEADVPTGTTADVIVGAGGSLSKLVVAVYRLVGGRIATVSANDQFGVASLSVSIPSYDGEALIFSAMGAHTDNPVAVALTGVDEDVVYGVDGVTGQHAIGHRATTSDLLPATLTATWTGTGNADLSAISVRSENDNDPLDVQIVEQTSGFTNSIDYGGTVNAGDLIVLTEYVQVGSGGTFTAGTPTGFTSFGNNSATRMLIVVSVKIAAGTEAGTTVSTGISGITVQQGYLATLARFDAGGASLTVGGAGTSANTGGSTISSGSGTAPLYVISATGAVGGGIYSYSLGNGGAFIQFIENRSAVTVVRKLTSAVDVSSSYVCFTADREVYGYVEIS